MNYICLLLGYCWDPDHDPCPLYQVLCSACLIGSPSVPWQPYEKSLLSFISLIQTLARVTLGLVPHPIRDGYTRCLANTGCSFIHTCAYQKLRFRIITKYKTDASWAVIIYECSTGWPSVHASVSRFAIHSQNRHWPRGTKLSARWMWSLPFLSLYSGRESNK